MIFHIITGLALINVLIKGKFLYEDRHGNNCSKHFSALK